MDSRYLPSPVETSSLFKMLFQNARSTSMLIMDSGGNILDINSGFQKFSGYQKEFLIGKNFSLLFVEEDKIRQLPEKEIEKAIVTGSANDEGFFKKKDGSLAWVNGESIFTSDENGQAFIIKIIYDTHSTKRLEEELRKNKEEQEKIIRDRDTFIYIASHDLQTPIANIEGLINGLKDGYPDREEFEDAIEMMDLSVKRFRATITELYAMGKKQEESKAGKETGFAEALDDVLLDLEEDIVHSNAEIYPDFSQAPTVTFSRKNLKTILQNLVSNSLKFRSPFRKPKIVVRTEKSEDGYLALKVIDNGIGIRPGDMDKIFNLYFRGNEQIAGTGVGMAIVKRLVDGADGKIEVESTLGEGTTFTLFFPIGQKAS
jgi:PAS domain S-box-containing protein